MTFSLELYTAAGCEHIATAREYLELRVLYFVDYDLENSREACVRMLGITGANRTVPLVFEKGKPVQVGWMGRGCFI